MTFELPADGNLVPLLRRAAFQGFDQRGDLGDFSPFDWVGRLYESVAWQDSVDDAFATLLTAEDPFPSLVIEQITKLPGRSFLPRLYRTIEGRCAELAARVDTSRTDGRSLLGSIMHAVGTMGKVVHPSVALAHELVAFERPEDGWPITFRIALASDLPALLPRLTGVLERLDDEQLDSFARGMVADGPPWTDVVFEAIGRGPPAIRDRVARAVRRFTNMTEESRATLRTMEVADPELQAMLRAAADKPDPWPEYAARLGVAET